ncbi:uncharacterized protein N7477_000997 [Penicillium maclennaniae]|uniref:uncharacterized protein n=1 Tax=Penicillium maclennaniae TaxID=1343394 RepID=UPI00254061A1|nr:uncharacterized protein N7477_000997 [Penicillium maclennaniae]KAJ5684652.1 hypothetical protein N7477_000997 [Penicillium maclennaniae]
MAALPPELATLLSARPLHIASHLPKRNTLDTSSIIKSTLSLQKRNYSFLHPSGKATGDLLVEELQDLYEAATDEFEIATDSTDSATIYAASDRESARDALNQFIAVYHLYSAKPGEKMEGVGQGGV